MGCAIEVGFGEDTEENALASADTGALALTMVERGLIVFILMGVGGMNGLDTTILFGAVGLRLIRDVLRMSNAAGGNAHAQDVE